MKRIVTIQDISCIGKCSLTVALPVISSFGIEVAIIPTAVLSTHTAFESFSFFDHTDEINIIKEEWKKQNFKFDAIYTGYLGSKKQIETVTEFFAEMKSENTLIFVDPAMADNGKLYSGFSEGFAKEMTSLCKKADIIVPNITEASLMLGLEYKESGYSEKYIKDMLKGLCDLGAKKAVITGVSFNDSESGIMSFNSETNEFFSYFNKKFKKTFHGTGDIFASTCVGGITKGFPFEKALEIAVDFTVESIKETIKDKNSNWYGVNFETALPYLINKISE